MDELHSVIAYSQVEIYMKTHQQPQYYATAALVLIHHWLFFIALMTGHGDKIGGVIMNDSLRPTFIVKMTAD